MKKLRRTDFVILAVILALIIGITLIVMSGGGGKGGKTSAEPTETAPKTLTVADYNGKKIGVQTGTVFDQMVKEQLPKSEVSYFNSYTDLLSALKAGTIDAFTGDEPMVKYMMAEDGAVDYLKDYLDDYSFGFAFPKNDKGKALCDEFSEYIKQIKSDGTLQQIDDIWFGTDESVKDIPDLNTLPADKGTLSLALESLNAPFVFVQGSKIVGYEVDVAYRFCKEKGYGLELVDMNFDGIIPAVSGGKCDFGCSTINITEERAESVNFSEPHYDGGSVLAIRKSDMGGTASASAEPDYTEWNGKRMGIMTGSSVEPITLDKFPDSEYFYYDNIADLVTALQNNKIDGFLYDEPVLRTINSKQKDVNYLKKPVQDDDYSFGFAKSSERTEKLLKEFNSFLADLKNSGELDRMNDKWFSDDESVKTYDDSELPNVNGELVVVANPEIIPFTYISNNKLTGYAVEVITEFARKYGYSIRFEQGNTAACLAGMSSGKYDIFIGSLSVTEERKQSMDFADSFYDGGVVLAVRTADLGGKASAGAVEDRPFSYYAENGKIGAITGGLYEVMILERFPDANVLQFNNQPDMAVALSAGNIDAFTCPLSSAQDFIKADPSLTYLKEVFTKIPYGFAFPKTAEKEKLRDQMNEYLKKIHDDGTYDEIVSVWFGEDDSKKTVDLSGLTGENGTLRYITAPTMQPFSYVANNTNVGLEADIIARFCKEYGYGLKIDSAEFASLIPGITSGMYDIASGTIMITEERAQSVNFSDVYYTTDAVAVVRKEAGGTSETISDDDTSWLSSIKESFEKNFIREDRYKLILEGIGTTCLITLLTVLFGSILAFLICLFRRTDSLLANKIANLYVRILQGTPLVVLLMILYYVVFGNSGISAVWVAVIGFSLNFGAYVSEILRSGIESIDSGQREAALALGFSENQSFFRFIFPQAAIRQLPVYRGEVISLLKNTSIVGYIAIQDLTKMSDIIRSRTYEAFFPLIATAVIYFIIAWVITLILNMVLKRIDPRSKKKKSKGAAAK